jgi:hypothetical protein
MLAAPDHIAGVAISFSETRGHTPGDLSHATMGTEQGLIPGGVFMITDPDQKTCLTEDLAVEVRSSIGHFVSGQVSLRADLRTVRRFVVPRLAGLALARSSSQAPLVSHGLSPPGAVGPSRRLIKNADMSEGRSR